MGASALETHNIFQFVPFRRVLIIMPCIYTNGEYADIVFVYSLCDVF